MAEEKVINWEAEEVREAKELVERLSRFVNRHNNMKLVVDGVTNDHRTLQQGMMRLFMACVQRWAEQYDKGEGWYDLRNAATVKISKQIVSKLGDEIHMLPLI